MHGQKRHGKRPVGALPRVSIIMPVYNGSKYVSTALESALAQDYANLEILVINDGSTDNTKEILEGYSDHRIRYFEKENGGVATALNVGIREMTGEYFCWLSHDDVYLPYKVSAQVRIFLMLYAGQNVILCSDYHLIDEEGKDITTVRLDHALLMKKPEYVVLRGSVHGCSAFIPRRFFDEVGLFDASLPGTQDYDLWSRAIETWRFVHLPEPLISSRWHPEQGSKKADYTPEMAALWIRIIDALSTEAKIRLEGNAYRFYNAMEAFLSLTKIDRAAQHAGLLAERSLDDIKVSVVVPCHKSLADIRASAASVLAQTHPNIELIVVTDCGSDQPGEATPDAIRTVLQPSQPGHSAIVVTQSGRGAASARNHGISLATGEYIALLDADDLYLPLKVRRQLERMLVADAEISHTSYFSYSADGSLPAAIHPSGQRSGNLFPAILSNCPIACPTVMAKADFLNEHRFPEHAVFCEDVMLWMRVASQHEFLGIDEPMSIVSVSRNSAAYSPVKQHQAIDQLVSFLRDCFPDFPEHAAALERAKPTMANDAGQSA